ncbi:unnamed protein product [Phytophthora fragariaefolia]|uniref:Unnamed protein product n=1 Tax=Phytophthora fragariaefolia TaxID=1490495 RepID=A0A9W6XLY5_9STRA|nr:unnamed protein product [Phytophthora fragariaefolia]
MEEFGERLGAVHSFVPVYTPWINVTVEKVHRDILQVLRVMLLEHQVDTRNWAYLLPLIQANLSHSPVHSLGDCAPVELFTGLPAPSALDVVVTPQDKLPRTLPLEKETFRQTCEELRTSLHALHRVVRDRRERSRAKYDVHRSRLKFYYDGDLNVTVEICGHMSFQGIVLEVLEIVDHRVNTATDSLELLVAWRGLKDIENSWEPASAIQHDIPVSVAKYAIENDISEQQ